MKYKEFLEFMEVNLENYHTFVVKARKFQQGLNAKREKKCRWSDEKVEKAVCDMWKKSMESLYSKLKKEIDSDSLFTWTSFIETNGIIESVNEGINDIDFSSGEA